MSEKLKTLNDIELEGHTRIVTSQNLRAAAREWINLLEKDLAKPDKEIERLSQDDVGSEACGKFGHLLAHNELIRIIAWIRYFFNLDEGENP